MTTDQDRLHCESRLRLRLSITTIKSITISIIIYSFNENQDVKPHHVISIHKSMNQSAEQSVSQSKHKSVNQSSHVLQSRIHSPTDQSFTQPIKHLNQPTPNLGCDLGIPTLAKLTNQQKQAIKIIKSPE